MKNIQITYSNGKRMTSRKFRSARLLVKFLKTDEVKFVYYIIG